VLVAHAFIAGCRESESERALTVGGSGAVGASLFEAFDYVALGHLHEPQVTASARVRYAGSLLKYSFNEASQRKSVTLVDIDGSGAMTVEEVALPIKRDVRQVRGHFEEILALSPDVALADAYVEVVLTDTEPVLSPLVKLKPVFPNVLSIKREVAERSVAGLTVNGVGVKTRDALDLFAEFFEDVQDTTLSEPQTRVLAAVSDGLERAEREVVAP